MEDLKKEYTPGPWKAREQGVSGSYFVTDSQDEWLMSIQHTGVHSLFTEQNNIKVMAAAPCMLSILEKIILHGEDSEIVIDSELIQQIYDIHTKIVSSKLLKPFHAKKLTIKKRNGQSITRKPTENNAETFIEGN